MTSQAAQRRRSSSGAARRQAAQARRRRLGALVFVALAALAVVLFVPKVKHAAKEIALPLRHEDIIRQQSSAKGLDPALVAGVIYAESRFADQTSSAGARGLMQITPETAQFIAQRSGGSAFTQEDLATPQVNISYGTYYLAFLLKRYGGDTPLALAAYNAGQGNVDRWISDARSTGQALTIDAIPYGETRAYVKSVLHARAQYRSRYKRELGL